MNKDALALAAAGFACWLMACSPGSSDPSDRKVASAQTSATPPIRSQAQLDAYLKTHVRTPIDLLSPGARERFLLSLHFGDGGLNGIDRSELADELTQNQIQDVMILFGPQIEQMAPKSRLRSIPGGTGSRPPSSAGGISDVERRYNLFYRASMDVRSADDNVYIAQLTSRLDTLLPEVQDRAALSELDDRDLRLLSRASEVVARESRRSRYVGAFENVFAERERRRLTIDEDVKTLQDLLLSMRRFEEAERLAAEHPEAHLPALPAFRDSLGSTTGQPTVWRLEPGTRGMTRTAIDLGPTQVLVTAGCHFSQDAAEDISKDAILGPAFASHARWLVQAPGIEDIAAVQDWNRRFPRAQAHMIHARDEWTLFPTWTMPVFYVVRDGKVIDKVSGWPRNPAENRQPLIEALRRAELLTAATPTGKSD